MQVSLPDDLTDTLTTLVREGRYPTLDDAVSDLIRKGLQARGRPARPIGTPPPGQPELPASERPTEVDPTDRNWMA